MGVACAARVPQPNKPSRQHQRTRADSILHAESITKNYRDRPRFGADGGVAMASGGEAPSHTMALAKDKIKLGVAAVKGEETQVRPCCSREPAAHGAPRPTRGDGRLAILKWQRSSRSMTVQARCDPWLQGRRWKCCAHRASQLLLCLNKLPLHPRIPLLTGPLRGCHQGNAAG